MRKSADSFYQYQTKTCNQQTSLYVSYSHFNIGVNRIKKKFKSLSKTLLKSSYHISLKKKIKNTRRSKIKTLFFQSRSKKYLFIGKVLQNLIFKRSYLKKKEKLQAFRKNRPFTFKTYYVLEHLFNKKRNRLVRPFFKQLSNNLKKKKFEPIRKSVYPIFKKKIPYSHINLFNKFNRNKVQTITDLLLVNRNNLTEKYSIKTLKKIPWKAKSKITYYLVLRDYLITRLKIFRWKKKFKKFIFLTKKVLRLLKTYKKYHPYRLTRRVLLYSLTSRHISKRLYKYRSNHWKHSKKISVLLKKKKKSLKFFFKKLRYSWAYIWMRRKTNKFQKVKRKPKKIFFKKKIKNKYKHQIIRFWFFFSNSSKIKYYRIKSFYKKFLIFKSYFNKFIFIKLNKKTQIKFGVYAFFWKLESRIDIFLIRNGFVRNIEQSNFILKNKLVYINNNLVLKNYSCVSINDIIQINWFFILFTKLFFDKLVDGFFFFFKI